MKDILIYKNGVEYKMLVDDEDYDLVISNGSPVLSGGKYARMYIRGSVPYKSVTIHRFILESHGVSLEGKYVDHINFNGLDNRKENLRPCSPRQNSQHSRKRTGKIGKNKYKGIKRNGNYWSARIQERFIGNFLTEEDAAMAYDIYAEKEHGEFACKNFINISKEDCSRIIAILEYPQYIKRKNSASAYHGVSKGKNGKFRTRIQFNGKRLHLGEFRTDKEAAEAYNKKAIELFGSKARLNTL